MRGEMPRPAQIVVDGLADLGFKVEKVERGEIYRLDSKILWFDYSRERKGVQGEFFHGTSKKIFEKFYSKYPESFYIVFLLGFEKTTEAIVVSANRFHEMFKDKATDKVGDWKYSIQHTGDEYVVKVWGIRDVNITDGLHNYTYFGLNFQQSEKLKKIISPHSVPHQVRFVPKSFPALVSSARIDSHESAQGTLAILGRVLGFETWIPARDRSKTWDGKQLGELVTLARFPEIFHLRKEKFVREIDVIWFLGDVPAYCFEVEHTTHVRDGLWRQYQIAPLTSAKFFIVGPDDQRTKFETEVEGDPFRSIKTRYQFKSYNDLIDFYDEAKKFTNAKSQFGL
jgi:hypothetical protein